jgi:hypothetical protein
MPLATVKMAFSSTHTLAFPLPLMNADRCTRLEQHLVVSSPSQLLPPQRPAGSPMNLAQYMVRLLGTINRLKYITKWGLGTFLLYRTQYSTIWLWGQERITYILERLRYT